jgi:hypothetical protein
MHILVQILSGTPVRVNREVYGLALSLPGSGLRQRMLDDERRRLEAHDNISPH